MNKLEKICNLYLMIMFSLFLFWFHDGFYDITKTKYMFFSVITCIMLLLVFIIVSFNMLKYKNKIPSVKIILKKLNTVDKLMLIFLFVSIISTIISNYSHEAFTGATGRYQGLFTIILYCGIYFVISRCYRHQQSILLLFFGSSSFVGLLGILNFLGIDFLGFYEWLSDYQSNLYLSTLGNTNFYASIFCISLPLCIVLFCAAKEKTSNIIYAIMIMIHSISILISNSDGAHFSMIILLILIAFYSLNKYDYLLKYLFVLLLYLGSAKIFGLLLLFMNSGHYLHTISSILVYNSLTYILIITVLIALGILIWKKDIYRQEIVMQHLKHIYSIYLIVGVVSVSLICLLYNNLGHFNLDIPYVSNYLRFNKDWGTGRGEIWTMMMDAWSGQDLMVLIFGSGPDTVRFLMRDFFQNSKMMIYDSAHNELLQYLITTGVIGFVSYIGMQLTTLKKLFKYRFNEPYSFALFCALLCYMIQSLFSIGQPITSPIFIIFISMGMAFIRLKETRNEN